MVIRDKKYLTMREITRANMSQPVSRPLDFASGLQLYLDEFFLSLSSLFKVMPQVIHYYHI